MTMELPNGKPIETQTNAELRETVKLLWDKVFPEPVTFEVTASYRNPPALQTPQGWSYNPDSGKYRYETDAETRFYEKGHLPPEGRLFFGIDEQG